MTEHVTVIIATFGDRRWERLAHQRALPSVCDDIGGHMDGIDVIVNHSGKSVSESRNTAVAKAKDGLLLMIDADDEIEPGYMAAMLAAYTPKPVLLAPMLRYVEGDTVHQPMDLSGRDIAVENPCCIGTMIHKRLFDAAGGFWNERGFEDWSLFRRAWMLGAQVRFVRRAVYRAHLNRQGRNLTIDRPGELCDEIRASHDVWYQQRQKEEAS